MTMDESAADAVAVLAGSVVAGLDRDARTYSAPRWKSHQADYQATIVELCRIGEFHQPLHDVMSTMIIAKHVTDHYDALVRTLRGCRALPEIGGRIDRLAAEVAGKVRLYHLAATKAGIHEAGGPPYAARSATGVRPIRVVIPFRARPDQSLRLRNLRACLAALHRQTLDRRMLHITLVESDCEARHRSEFDTAGSLVDQYLFHRDTGPFNKAAAVNIGAADAGEGELLCLLDADMLLAPGLLGLAAWQVADGCALLPYTDALCLDPVSSRAYIQALQRDVESSAQVWSGYVLRDPPGGCVMVTSADFRALGGFDTRFTGWGGEDRDFVERLEVRGLVRRLAGAMIHLHHERPAMREDHDGIMRDARAKASRA